MMPNSLSQENEPTLPRTARRFGKKVRRQIARLFRVGYTYPSEEERAVDIARYLRIYRPINDPSAPRPAREQLLEDLRAMMGKRIAVPRSVHIYVKGDGLCALCLAPVDFYTWAVKSRHGPERLSHDHIHPKGLGGDNKHSNIRLTHGICNRVRDQWSEGDPLPTGRKGDYLRLLLRLAEQNRLLPPDQRVLGSDVLPKNKRQP